MAREPQTPNDRRAEKFHAYKNHPWLGRVYAKLTRDEILLAEAFMRSNQKLGKGEFEMAINRMFLDKEDKPKNWTRISELLTNANCSLSDEEPRESPGLAKAIKEYERRDKGGLEMSYEPEKMPPSREREAKREIRRAIEKRAKEIYKTMKTACDCGGDDEDAAWHHESCSVEQAWDAAMLRAEDERQ